MLVYLGASSPPPEGRGKGFIERPRAEMARRRGDVRTTRARERRPSPNATSHGRRTAPAQHLAHYLPAPARGRGASDRTSGRGPSTLQPQFTVFMPDVCQ